MRFLKIADTSRYAVERLDHRNSITRMIGDTLLESPMPVEDYHSVLRVQEMTHESASVEWSSTFAPNGLSREDAKNLVQGLQAQGLVELKALFAPRVSIQKFINMPRATVWAIVGDFAGWDQFFRVFPEAVRSPLTTALSASSSSSGALLP